MLFAYLTSHPLINTIVLLEIFFFFQNYFKKKLLLFILLHKMSVKILILISTVWSLFCTSHGNIFYLSYINSTYKMTNYNFIVMFWSNITEPFDIRAVRNRAVVSTMLATLSSTRPLIPSPTKGWASCPWWNLPNQILPFTFPTRPSTKRPSASRAGTSSATSLVIQPPSTTAQSAIKTIPVLLTSNNSPCCLLFNTCIYAFVYNCLFFLVINIKLFVIFIKFIKLFNKICRKAITTRLFFLLENYFSHLMLETKKKKVHVIFLLSEARLS